MTAETEHVSTYQNKTEVIIRPKLYTTVSKNTTVVLHREMKEQDCNKSQAVDFIVEYYSKMQNNLMERQVEETAELVIEKLKLKKLVQSLDLISRTFGWKY
jgi:hypothetical protein